MSLVRQTIRHTAIYSFSTVLGKLIAFIMLPFYAHIFLAEGYGVIAMVDASIGALSIVFAAGLHLAIVRVYHQEAAEAKKRVIGTGICLVGLGTTAAILIPMAFVSPISRFLLGGEQYSTLLVLALITFVIDLVGQSASTSLIIKQRSIVYSAINLVRLTIGLTLNIWLVVILQIGLIGIFISALVTSVLGSSVLLGMVVLEYGIRFDKKIARKLLAFQLPLIPGDLTAFVARQAEMFLVRFILDVRAAGVLAMAYKFPPLLNLFISLPFGWTWRTKALELAEERKDAPDMIGRMFTNYLYVMVFAGVVLAVCIEDLLILLTPKEFWEAARIARIEIVTTILAGSTAYLMFGLIFCKMTGTISKIKITMAIVKVPLAFLMINAFHLAGAAYAALIVECVTTFVVMARSQQHYPISIEYFRIFIIAGWGIVVFGLLATNVMGQEPALSSIKHSMGAWVSDVLDVAALIEPHSQRLSRLVVERFDSLISLFVNVVGSFVYLISAPVLLALRKETNPLLGISR